MIINGASRSNGAFFARHLMRADHNERVTVMEMRGFSHASDVREAFGEMQDRAEGSRIKNPFYHVNINTRADELLTPEQWTEAIDATERALGFEGQQRLVIGHGKDGRDHVHVVWSRVYLEQVGPEPGDVIPRAISDSWNYRVHEEVATELEQRFEHQTTTRALTRDKETTPRPEPGMKGWEDFRAQESKIDPKAMRAELTELWQHSDSGPAFAAALEERGYILARGDRRDFCVIDQAGDEHSLGRRISGVKAAEIRSRMEDVDREALPSVDEARALARQRQDEQPQDSSTTGKAEAPPAEPVALPDAFKPDPAPSLFDAKKADLAKEAQAQPAPMAEQEPPPASLFDRTRERCAQEAAAAPQMPEEQGETSASRLDRFRAWCGTMRGYVEEFGQQVREYWGGWFRAQEPEAEPEPPPQGTPSNTVSAPTLDNDRNRQQGMEPGL